MSFSPKPILALAGLIAATLGSPASAMSEPRTRLVECEAGSCLLVTGSRAHPASTVSINGRAVPVEGSRKWRATLPVETLREWSAPNARTITVAVVDASSRKEALAQADLPIGLLGHIEDMAMLVVRVK